jgi:hypothetical protein
MLLHDYKFQSLQWRLHGDTLSNFSPWPLAHRERTGILDQWRGSPQVLAKTADQLHDLQRTVLRLQTERDELLSSVHSARGAQGAAPVCGSFWEIRLAME